MRIRINLLEYNRKHPINLFQVPDYLIDHYR